MAKKQVKTTQVECWGNPTEALKCLNSVKNYHTQESIRTSLAHICCLLTPLGFNCSMSFWHNLQYHCIFSNCFITIGDEEFKFFCNEQTGDDIEAFCGRIADFISKHTEKDGLFHYTYEWRAEA